ncbi:MAG: NADPH-dependent FMN reductase [Bacteroidota bacterium]
MRIVGIVGSASKNSGNEALLNVIKERFAPDEGMVVYNQLRQWPLFRPEDLESDQPRSVLEFKEIIENADAVIISTPEYSHNIPAVLKNMLEWCTASGEFNQKPVLAITYAPKPPRGEHAMKSLLYTLQTLKAQVKTQLPLYKSDLPFDGNTIDLDDQHQLLLEEAVRFLLE